MKRIIIMFVLSLVLVLTACTTDNTKTPKDTEDPQDVVVVDATITGVTDVTVLLGATFNNLEGVSAAEADGTDLTANITVTGTVEVTTPGTYTLTYKVTGASGNEVSKVRNVVIVSNQPVITVNPVTITITEGDDLDLMLGVTVTDDFDTNLTVTIKDNGGFDKTIPGTYVITYEATDSEGHNSTVTREVIVEEILLSYFIEVQNELDAKWGSKILTVAGKDYIEVAQDYDLGDPTSITLIRNTSTEAIVVTSSDLYGEAAVINANGAVVEGRDGANGKLVNADNPLRASGATLDPKNYAVNVTIPAGGFFLIAPNNPDGNFDTDGRSFIAKNVIYKFENIISIYLEDNSAVATNYIDRAPSIENLGKIEIIQDTVLTTDELEALVKAGVNVKDDNGTFDPSDDIVIELTDVLVQVDSTFNVNVLGEYIFLLGAVDAQGNPRTVQRIVEVVPSTPTVPTLEVNGKRFEINASLINPSTIVVENVNFFTPDFSGDVATLSVKWGLVVVVDGTGKIVLARDPYGNEYTVETPTAVAGTVWNAGNMMAGLTNPTEGYIMVFPNGSPSRQFGLDNARVIGAQVNLYHTYFTPTIDVNQNTYSFPSTNVNPETLDIQNINVFTSNFTGDITAFSVKWGVVVVVDANGKIIITRDGVNGKQIDVDHPSAATGLLAADAGWAADNMMAGLTIPQGGLVIVFPNNGTNGPDSPRTFGVNHMRTYGLDVTFHRFVYQPAITASGKTMTAIVNPTAPVTTSAMIFDSNYGAAIDFSLGFGVLVVVDENGKVVKVHDGANAKYWDVDNTLGISATGYFTSGDYTNGVVIPTGGYVLIFPNNGTNLPDSPRTFGMGLRTIGLDVVISLGL